MKRASILCLLLSCCAVLFALPAGAATIWDNGPASGQFSSRDIGETSLSQTWDSFTVTGPPTMMNKLTFGGWVDPGDMLVYIAVEIFTQPDNGGTFVFGSSASVFQSNCVSNSAGGSTCLEAADFGGGPMLTAGTYWLSLYSAGTAGGARSVGWDINQGIGCTSPGCPSQAVDETGSTIPSESFTIYPEVGQQPTPEPGTLLLLGTGAIGIAGAVRRKMIR